MPRQIIETFAGYQASVQRHTAQVLADDGIPLHDGQGNPKMIEVTNLVLSDPTSAHQVIIPFDEEGRLDLISKLSSGIVLAGNGNPR